MFCGHFFTVLARRLTSKSSITPRLEWDGYEEPGAPRSQAYVTPFELTHLGPPPPKSQSGTAAGATGSLRVDRNRKRGRGKEAGWKAGLEPLDWVGKVSLLSKDPSMSRLIQKELREQALRVPNLVATISNEIAADFGMLMNHGTANYFCQVSLRHFHVCTSVSTDEAIANCISALVEQASKRAECLPEISCQIS